MIILFHGERRDYRRNERNFTQKMIETGRLFSMVIFGDFGKNNEILIVLIENVSQFQEPSFDSLHEHH